MNGQAELFRGLDRQEGHRGRHHASALATSLANCASPERNSARDFELDFSPIKAATMVSANDFAGASASGNPRASSH